MNIAVIGANGKAGQCIVHEAVRRGHHVTAVTRRAVDTGATTQLIKDVFSVNASDLAACEVIVDAFGVWDPELLHQHKQHLEHLNRVLTPAQRLVVVGSAGGLFVASQQRLRVVDSPQMPPEFRPLAMAMLEGFEFLVTEAAVDWTYISPPLDFQAAGPRTGSYQLGGDELMTNTQGESTLSYADYAIAVIDEIERPSEQQHHRQRISVVSN